MIMTTKLILPWRVKPGMRTRYFDTTSNAYVEAVVESVHRGKSTFAGGNITIVRYQHDPVAAVLHHRKPTAKFYQVIP